MPEMVLHRDFTLATTRGHRIKFDKDKPTLVPATCVPDATAIGAKLVDGRPADVIDEGPKLPRAPDGAEDRAKEITAAIEMLVERNERDDFNAGAAPKETAIAKIVGWKVHAKERDAAWQAYHEAKAAAKVNSGDILDAFRLEVSDVASPQLWSDEEIYRYMDDAYFQFVRLTGGVGDFTSGVSEVSASEGEEFSDLDPSILTVRKVYRADGREIGLVNAENLPVTGETDYGSLPELLMNTTTGPIKAMVIGLEPDKVRWVPVPAADEEIKLLVYRLPLVHISDENHEITDVKEQHHLHLMDWMKSRAYRKQDAETYNPAKAQEFEALFREYCGQVKSEWERYKHKPRTIMYGGI